MKKLIISFLGLLTFLLSTQTLVVAQTTTPRPTNQSITNTLSEQITDLKEKIASRVAELDLVEKKGIIGVADEIDDTQITLTDIYGQIRVIDVDEITNFSSPDDEESFGISDITPGTKISVLGLYNKETERLLARFVSVVTLPTYIAGPISEIDEDEFTITVDTQDAITYTIDIETSTRTQEYLDEDFENAGFSDLEVGQYVFVTGFEDEDDQSQISASRILIYQTTGDINSASPTPEEDESEE